MGSTSTNRIQKELINLQKRDLEGVEIAPVSDNNLLEWRGEIKGPANTPYKGGRFEISLTFPHDYPFTPPAFKFLTPIYHPNVDDQGSICLSLLKDSEWKPATRVVSILEGVLSLLVTPNPDDPLVASIADTYINNRRAFDRAAKEHVKKYAMGN